MLNSYTEQPVYDPVMAGRSQHYRSGLCRGRRGQLLPIGECQ
jgi:hypothetical protein